MDTLFPSTHFARGAGPLAFLGEAQRKQKRCDLNQLEAGIEAEVG